MAVRVLLGIVAALVLAASIALGAGASWLWTTFGDGALRRMGTIEATAPMIVIDIDDVAVRTPVRIPGRLELVVDAGDAPVTVLAGPTPEVDRVLFGTSYEVASLAGGAWTTIPVRGVRPAPDLATADLGDGLVSTTGAPVVLDAARIAPGSIVIGRDTSALGAVSIDLRYLVADARTISLIGGAIALFMLCVAIVLLWAAIIGMRGRGRHE